MTRSKSLSPQQNERARAELQKLVASRFNGDVGKAATAFGVKQPTLWNFLNAERGIGSKLLSGVARVDAGVAAKILGAATTPLPSRADAPEEPGLPPRAGKLSSVRDYLYKRYSKQIVDTIIAESKFIDASELDELRALDELDELIRGLGAPQIELDVDHETRQLAQSVGRRGSERTRK